MGCSLERSVAEELVVGYAARTLDSKAEADFERHLESCPRCRELVHQQRAVWSALEEWQPLALSPTFDQKLFERIAQSERANAWMRPFANWTWRPLVPVAAACAVLLFAFLLRDDDRSGTAAPGDHPRLRIEQQVEHALDDMDMLKQIGVDVSVERLTSSQKI